MAKINIDITVNQRDAQRKIERLQKSTQNAQRGFRRLQLSVNNSTSAFKVFAGNVAAVGFAKLVSGIGSFVGASINAIKEVEDLNTQFQVLTGSAAAANQAVQDLTAFAAKTPFQLSELATAQQRLLSFQFSLEESQDLLGELGDVAAAANKPIGELALIFGQVSAAGKLTGERLLQLEERAIPIGPAIAKTMGIAEGAVRDAVRNGEVDFKTFEKAFRSLNDTGEFAFDGMIKRSRTLSGRISTLKDNFFLLAASVGQDSNLGVSLKALVSSLTVFIERIGQSSQFKSFLTFIGDSIPKAINFAIQSFSFVINTIFNVVKVFNLFRSGVASALSFVVNAFTNFIDVYATVINALGLGDTAIGRSINSVKNFRDNVTDSLDATADSFAESAAEISIAQEKTNNAIDSGSKFIQESYAQEKQAAEELANATVDANTKKQNSVRQLTAEEIAAQQERQKLREKEIEELRAAQEEKKLAEEEFRLFTQEQEQIFTDSRLIQLQDYFTREEEARIQAGINAAENERQKQKLIIDAQAEGLRKQIEQKKAAEEAKANFAQANRRSQINTLRETSNLIIALGGRENKAAFAIAKGVAFAENIIRTQQEMATISATFAAAPPVAAALVAQAKARGVIRGATIAATAVQGFETGGVVPGASFTGDRVAARVNSGEMILTRQQQSRLFQLANSQGGGATAGAVVNQPIVIELDNEVVGRATSKWVANGGQLGEVQ